MNTNHPQQYVKYAWINIYNYGKKLQTVKLFSTISWAMKLGFDCKSFLGGLAMCLNRSKALNYARTWNSVFKFFLGCKAPIWDLKNPKFLQWQFLFQGVSMQLNHTISFVWVLLTQNNHNSMLNMHESKYTILEKCFKPWNCLQRFLELWSLVLIANRSSHSQQCIWITIMLWIGLEYGIQFSSFLEFFGIGYGLSCRVFTCNALGLGFVHIMQWS